MDIDVLITGGVGVITTFISGFTSYLFTKRKYDAEVDSDKISNMQSSLEFYEKNQDANKKILDELLEENAKFREENRKLKEQVDAYEDKIRQLLDTNEQLLDRVSKLEALINKPERNEVKTKKSSEKA